MTDEKLALSIKDFLKGNSIDELQEYLAGKGCFKSKEEWNAMLRPILREIEVPEDMIEKTISDTYED